MQVKLEHTLRSLSLESEVISVESLSRHLPNKPLLAKLSQLAQGVSEFISEKTEGLFNRSQPVKFHLSGSPAGSLKNVQYLDLKDVVLPCPEGLQLSYVAYAELLLDAQKITSYLLEDCLYPFSVFISESLNNPEKMSSSLRTSGVKLNNLEPVRRRMAAAFDGVVADQPYTKLIARNGEWDDLEKLLAKLVNTQKQSNDKLVAEKVEEIQVNLDRLIDRMQDSNEKYRPSSELIAELSKLTFGLAEQVTFYAIVSNSIESFYVTLEQAKTVIKAAAKK